MKSEYRDERVNKQLQDKWANLLSNEQRNQINI
jgi:hypothetical protein